jgi:thiol-disulfide isomerase/thioredoxin
VKHKGSGSEGGAGVDRRSVLAILASGLALPVPQAALAQWATRPEDAGRRPPVARRAELPAAADLAADGAASAKGKLPILLFFDREDCPYCERALREYLVPYAQEEWKGKAIFRQVAIDRTLPVRDFDGTLTTHKAIAARYRVALSPTVLVVDPRGAPLAEPIVGLTTLDFYGAYVQGALAGGARKLRG